MVEGFAFSGSGFSLSVSELPASLTSSEATSPMVEGFGACLALYSSIMA